MAEEQIIYDRIVIGRYAPILTKNDRVCNEKLASGMSMQDFIMFDYKFHEFHSHAQTPHLVVEYIVDGKKYYHALAYPRSSPIIQMNYFGKEVMVVYRSDNPWIACVRKDLNVEKEIMERHLLRQDYSQFENLNNMEYYGLGFVNGKSSPLSTAFHVDGASTKKEKTALTFALISLIPPVLGTASWVMTVIAFVMALQSEKEDGANHMINHNTIVLAIVGFILGAMASMAYIIAIFSMLDVMLAIV